MLLEAAAAAWLYAQQTSQDCFIFGEVSATEEQVFELKATGCPIKIERKGKLITLASPKFIVEITIPEAPTPEEQIVKMTKAINQAIKVLSDPLASTGGDHERVIHALKESIGVQKFLYQWGQSEATIGNQVINISYREVGGG